MPTRRWSSAKERDGAPHAQRPLPAFTRGRAALQIGMTEPRKHTARTSADLILPLATRTLTSWYPKNLWVMLCTRDADQRHLPTGSTEFDDIGLSLDVVEDVLNYERGTGRD